MSRNRKQQRKPGRPRDEALAARRQKEILDMAAGLFARHGYSGTDVQHLANVLGVGKGTVYRYFPTKKELFLSVADRAMHLLRAQIDEAAAKHDDPLDQFAAAVRAYLAFFSEHPHYVELIIQERAAFKDRKKPTYFEHRDANIDRWRGMFRDLIATGRVRPFPPEQITDVISDLLYGTIFTNHFAGRRKPMERQAADILDVFFSGVLSDPELDRWRKNS